MNVIISHPVESSSITEIITSTVQEIDNSQEQIRWQTTTSNQYGCQGGVCAKTTPTHKITNKMIILRMQDKFDNFAPSHKLLASDNSFKTGTPL